MVSHILFHLAFSVCCSRLCPFVLIRCLLLCPCASCLFLFYILYFHSSLRLNFPWIVLYRNIIKLLHHGTIVSITADLLFYVNVQFLFNDISSELTSYIKDDVRPQQFNLEWGLRSNTFKWCLEANVSIMALPSTHLWTNSVSFYLFAL